MTLSPSAARVLIATDNPAEGVQVQRLLQPHFPHLSVTSDPDSALRDFEEFKPDVVVLAFDTIEKAQSYCLGLYRFGPRLQQHPHRMILLCSKSELATAFELCKKQYFDDYVLHWPMAHDGKRLPMSVWVASREIIAARAAAPARAELRTHAKQLRDLGTALDLECSAAENNVTGADSALTELERGISSATEEFSQRIAYRGDGAVEITDIDALSRESARLKATVAAQTHHLREQTLIPMQSWAANLRGNVEPALAGAIELVEHMRNARPVIMVVDDDELSSAIVARALDTSRYEIIFAGDGAAALNQLRRVHPDAILMDIRLPGIDGVTFTRNLKAAPDLANIPIIMFSGDSRRETLLSSIEAGAADFIVKPFTRESLNLKLERVLAA
jgi:CheY-like chemotaxis protein